MDGKRDENTNWCQSVGGIVLKGNEVLLVRHTYGAGKGKLIIPGGYVKVNETPQEALCREVLEETTVVAKPTANVLENKPFVSREKHGEYSFYGI